MTTTSLRDNKVACRSYSVMQGLAGDWSDSSNSIYSFSPVTNYSYSRHHLHTTRLPFVLPAMRLIQTVQRLIRDSLSGFKPPEASTLGSSTVLATLKRLHNRVYLQLSSRSVPVATHPTTIPDTIPRACQPHAQSLPSEAPTLKGRQG